MFGIRAPVLTPEQLARKRKVALLNLPTIPVTGYVNPFYGKTHSEGTRDAMSIAKGTAVTVHELILDNLVFIVSYTSGGRASTALATMGYMISRPSILKLKQSGTPFTHNGRTMVFT